MTSLVTPGILEELEQENARLLSSDPGQRCRFCGCSEFNPCTILFAKAGSIVRLVKREGEFCCLTGADGGWGDKSFLSTKQLREIEHSGSRPKNLSEEVVG
jgi:hypothetical protein